MNRFLIFIVGFSLITALTKTYVVWAYLLGVSVFSITAAFAVINVVVIASKGAWEVKDIIDSRVGFLGVIAYLFVVPLLLSPNGFYIKAYTLNLVFFSYILLFLCKIPELNRVFLLRVGWIAFIVNLAAGLLSLVRPDLFQNLATIIEARETFMGRAVGFYLQANSFAYGVLVNFIFIVYLSLKGRGLALCGILTVLCLFLTGSRTGLVFGGGVVFTVMLIFQKAKDFRKEFLLTLVFGGVVAACLAPVVAKHYMTDLIEVVDRFKIFAASSSEDLKNDNSIAGRRLVQSYYIAEIKNSPILGHGYGDSTKGIVSGRIMGGAHNMYLKILYEGGVVYLVSYVCFICAPLVARKVWLGDYVRMTVHVALPVYLMLYGLMINTLDTNRGLYVLFGLLYWGVRKKLTKRGAQLRKR